MKKLILMSALVLGGLGITAADAQIGIHINLHLGSGPVYVPARPVEVIPAPVYDDYYYLPEVEAYYSVGEHCYYYMDGSSWISATYLPGRYHDFDWRTAKRYEIHGSRPYLHHEEYRGRYGGYSNQYNASRGNSHNYGRQNSYNNGQYADRQGGYSRGQSGYQQPSNHSNNGGFNNSASDRGHQSSHPSTSRGNSGQPANTGGHGQGSFGSSQHFAQNTGRHGRS